jgi:hypothetical protein
MSELTLLRSVTRDELYFSVNASENNPSLRDVMIREDRGGGEGREERDRGKGREKG